VSWGTVLLTQWRKRQSCSII